MPGITAHIKTPLSILLVVVRYVLAVVVAFVASMVVVVYFPDFFQAWRSDSPFWVFSWFFCIGLAGVGAGSICLPSNHRWIGSLCLLLLGLGFTLSIFGKLSSDDSEPSETSFFSPLVSLGTGGSIPVLIYFLLRLKSGSNLTEKEVMALVVSEACLAVAMFLLSCLFRIY